MFVVADVNEIPTNVHMQGGTVAENQAAGQLVAPDDPDNEYVRTATMARELTTIFLLEFRLHAGKRASRLSFPFRGQRTENNSDTLLLLATFQHSIWMLFNAHPMVNAMGCNVHVENVFCPGLSRVTALRVRNCRQNGQPEN